MFYRIFVFKIQGGFVTSRLYKNDCHAREEKTLDFYDLFRHS